MVQLLTTTTKILDWIKFKAFPDHKSNVSLLDLVENFVGKRENDK